MWAARTSTEGGRLTRDTTGADLARTWVGTGLLVASVLAVIAAVPLDRGVTAGLALVAVGALASRAILGLADARRSLGPFAVPLDITVELALALGAAWLTGGLRSPLLVVPAATLVVSRRFHGPAASRFQAVATVLGLMVLGAGSSALFDRPYVAVVRVLWPLAVLAALELASPGSAPAEHRGDGAAVPAMPRMTAESPVAPPPAPPAAALTMAAAPAPPREPLAAPPPRERERDLRAEILHDLRSPVSVIKVYADLIAERARRGEPPVDEHLQNLASEIELMANLVEGPSATRDRRSASPAPPSTSCACLASCHPLPRDPRREGAHRAVGGAAAGRGERGPGGPPARVPQRARQRAPVHAGRGRGAHPPVGGRRARPRDRQRHRRRDVGGGARPRLRHVLPRPGSAGPARGRTRHRPHPVRELVEAMGGSISLWSEADRGSEVRVLLPVATESVA